MFYFNDSETCCVMNCGKKKVCVCNYYKMYGVNVLAPQNVPHAISVLTLGSKVVCMKKLQLLKLHLSTLY